MKKFKALVPFAAVGEIFNPGDEGKADAYLVDWWTAADYCEDLGHIEEAETEEKEPEDSEPQNDPVEIPEDISEQIPEEEETKPENVENEPKTSEFSEMKYPQLKKLAKEAGIEGYHTMKQVDLIKALEGR